MNKILLVDDNESIRNLIEKYLTRKGYEVLAVDSATKGIEVLKKEKFPLVITDVDMPEINGLDFLLWIKENNPETYVIVISASKSYKETASNMGALCYFEKPVNFKELETVLQSLESNQVSGNSQHISLVDYLNLLVISGNKKNHMLQIKGGDNNSGYIYLSNGKLINSEYFPKTGLDAFKEIMNTNSIHFYDQIGENGEEDKEDSLILSENNLDISLADLLKTNNSEHNQQVLVKSKKLIEKEKTFSSNLSQKKILVVDDFETIRMMLSKYLIRRGFTVFTAESVKQGIEIINREAISLVISDVDMPEANGIQFLLWLKENFSHIPVIMSTGIDSDNVKQFASQKGAIGYFEKPYDLKLLQDYVYNTLFNEDIIANKGDITLIDFIQVVAFSKKDMLISVTDLMSKKEGTIHIKAGVPVHAQFNEKEGNAAFLEIIDMNTRLFADIPWRDPSAITITESLPVLLKNITEKITAEAEKPVTALVSHQQNQQFIQILKDKRTALEKFHSETDASKKFMIYDSGVVLGIVVGITTKEEVFEIMHQYSSIDMLPQRYDQMFFYNDIDLRIVFDNRNIVDEIHLGKDSRGFTESGIAIGDPLEKALEILGKPIMCTIKGAVWKNISLFCSVGNFISNIRLRNDNKSNVANSLQSSEMPKLIGTSEAVKTEKTVKPEISKEHVSNQELIDKIALLEKKLESLSKGFETEKKDENDTTIYEFGSVCGIIIGRTTRSEVFYLLTKHTDEEPEALKDSIIYKKFGLSIKLNQAKVVERILVNNNYQGKTKKGISIGDKLEKAFEVYDKPLYKSDVSAVWKGIAFLCDEKNIISSIKLESR